MKASYSKVSTYNDCPFKYRLRYLDKLETIPDDSPNNALYLGTAIHEGIESRNIEKAIESYKSNYSILDDRHEIEILKLETILPIAIKQIPEGEYEYKLDVPDEFVGYIDMLVKIGDNEYDLYDFKHSNNIGGYKRSGQIHVYKYYYERLTGNKIRNLYYCFIPKFSDILTEDTNKEDLRKRIIEDLNNKNIIFEKVEFDPKQVSYYFARKILMERANNFEKRYSTKCRWCEYQKYCSSNGKDTSELLKKDEISEVRLF